MNQWEFNALMKELHTMNRQLGELGLLLRQAFGLPAPATEVELPTAELPTAETELPTAKPTAEAELPGRKAKRGKV